MVDPTYAYIMAAAICAGILVARYTQVALPLTPREKLCIGLGAFCVR